MKERYYVMGFLETLTIVFIVLKLTEVIAWSWWAVFSPMLVGYAVIIVLGFIVAAIKIAKGENV
jgi:uncharacterized membrane protein YqjE